MEFISIVKKKFINKMKNAQSLVFYVGNNAIEKGCKA
jgi:hypothetical protein